MEQPAVPLPIISERFKGLRRMVGNTPMLAISYTFRNEKRTIYAKCEHLNLTGSIKDRMALHILDRAYGEGRIKPGDTIAEATSGNTGIAFSALGRTLGHPVRIFIPDWMSRERKDLIRSYGADIVPVSKEQGGFLGSIRLSEEYAAGNPNVFLPQQFSNSANVEAHERTTGPEIWWQLYYNELTPDAFIAGVGTGGTIMGAGRFLRTKNPAIKLYPLEPAESPTLSTGFKVGQHRIQGISDEFIPAIVDLSALNKVICVSDGDSIQMAQRLSMDLGLAVGISSGANFIGAVKIQNELGGDKVVVTVFSDDNKKYLSTDLLRKEPVKAGFLSPDVDLASFGVHKRVCRVCCSPAECREDYLPGALSEDLPAPDCPLKVR
jgi:cysteine synthase A